MQRLFPQKLLTVITTKDLEEKLVDIGRNRGATGYTFLKVRGAGASGKNNGQIDIDVSLKCHMTVPQGKMTDILDDIENLMKEGCYLTVFVSDVAVFSSDEYDSDA